MKVCGLAGASEEECNKVPAFLKRRFPLQELNNTVVKLSNILNAKGHRTAERIGPTDLELLSGQGPLLHMVVEWVKTKGVSTATGALTQTELRQWRLNSLSPCL